MIGGEKKPNTTKNQTNKNPTKKPKQSFESAVTSMFSKFWVREDHLAELESIFVLLLFVTFLEKRWNVITEMHLKPEYLKIVSQRQFFQQGMTMRSLTTSSSI